MSSDYVRQRALVLQGGGALGAYEAGAISGLCKEIIKEDSKNGITGKPIFDVIIGTSIGAINGSILVSQFLKKRKNESDISLVWSEAVKKLEDFWYSLMSSSIDINKICKEDYEDFWEIITEWKSAYANHENGIASKSAFEKYLFGKKALVFGLEKIYSKPDKILDKRFKDKSNTLPKYNNDRLRNSITNSENGAIFPIATSFDEKEPRLLVVSTDIEHGSTVTFDSYEKPDGTRKTMYSYNEKIKKFDYELRYTEGLEIEHIMACSAAPLFYQYEEIGGHKFWDGYFLNNTPLKELMEEHKSYWETKISDDVLSESIWLNGNRRVPDLDAYIINVYPREQKFKTDPDPDFIKNRLENIKNCDKSTYEEWVADLLTDYINIIEKIIEKGNEKGWRKDIEDILECDAKTTLFTYLPKHKNLKYKDLMKRRFKIDVKRIERKDDEDSVSSQFTDFSDKTIKELMEQGRRDAIEMMAKEKSKHV